MSNQISTQTLSFYGSELITLKVEDVIYTAVRPIVEALGLSWGSQQRKLEKSKGKFSCTHMKTTGSDGKTYEMLCMPLKKLNGWLFSINPEKVRPDLKERVIQYQEECFEALYNYWHFGKAERKTTKDERTGLRQAVSVLVSKKGLLYSDAYSLVHQRFNVEHIDELSAEQVGMAVEYVHKIYLEGELITDVPAPQLKEPVGLTEYESQQLAWDWFALFKCVEFTSYILPALDSIQSKFAPQAHSIVSEYGSMLRRHQPLIQKLTADFNVEAWGDENWNRVLPTIRDNDMLKPKRRLGSF